MMSCKNKQRIAASNNYVCAVTLLALAVFAFLPVYALAQSAAAQKLKLAFIPQENPEKLLGDIDRVEEYLTKELQIPVQGVVTIDHAAAVEALRNGDADIAFMGALPFVLAEAHIGAEALLSEIYRGSASYTSRIFVRRDSGIDSLDDLRNKDIAFSDPISESGYLYPLDLFLKAGLVQSHDRSSDFFGRVYFAGGYQQAMQAMVGGLVDAAGASQYADLLLSPEQQSQVTWLEESVEIPSHVVIAREKLDPELKDKFVSTMLRLNEPENKHMLGYLYGPDGYTKTNSVVFDDVRALAQRYGLIP